VLEGGRVEDQLRPMPFEDLLDQAGVSGASQNGDGTPAAALGEASMDTYEARLRMLQQDEPAHGVPGEGAAESRSDGAAGTGDEDGPTLEAAARDA